MLSKDIVSELIHSNELSQQDTLLAILLIDPDKITPTATVKELCLELGVTKAKKWNLSATLSKSKYCIKYNDGWKINSNGKTYFKDKFNLEKLIVTLKPLAIEIRSLLSDINDPQTKEFIEEAITCYENDLYRSAVVLSWVGAVSLLYKLVVQNHLEDFNNEASRRDTKWKTAKNENDLSRMKEHNFLEIIEAISIIGKNTKQELQNHCLKLRNSCGHPNSLKIGKNRVASHLEVLILNVFKVF